MSAPQKFMFDNAFDKDHETIDPLEELRAKFQEKIERAKKDAFEEGRQAGEKNALSSIENQAKTAVESLLSQSAELHQSYQSELEDIKAKAAEFGITAGSILASELLKKEPMPLIEEFFKNAFTIIGNEPEVTAALHPSMANEVQAVISRWQQEAAVQGTIHFITNENLKPTDVSLTWKDGGIERSIEDCMTAINTATTSYFQARSQMDQSQSATNDLPAPSIETNEQASDATINQSERPS